MWPRSFQVKKRFFPFVYFLRCTMPLGMVMKYLPLVSCSFGIKITYCHLAVFLKIARGAEGLEVLLLVASAEEYRDNVIDVVESPCPAQHCRSLASSSCGPLSSFGPARGQHG